MKERLTQSKVDDFRVPDGKAEAYLMDSEVVGLGVYARGNSRVWILRYRFNGRSIKYRVGPVQGLSLKDARVAAQRLWGLIASGHDPQADRQRSRGETRKTINWAMTRYEADLERQGNARRGDILRLLRRTLCKAHGSTEVHQLALPDMVELLRQRTEAGLDERWLRSRLSAFFGWAVSQGLVGANPLAHYRRPKKTRAEKTETHGRAMSINEARTLWRTLQHHEDRRFAGIVSMSLLTGCRIAEGAARMRWEDVNFEKAEWRIPADRAKTATEYFVPLCPQAITVLRQQPRMLNNPYVFPGPKSGKPTEKFKREMPRLRRDFEATSGHAIEHWILHDVRRTVRSGLGEMGVRPDLAELCINHDSRSAVEKAYNRHQHETERREILQRWADFITKPQLAVVTEDAPAATA